MLLKTRFYLPPLRGAVVRRHSLLARLQASDGGSVVLVAAPAGYGKTTLISQWLHYYPQTFAWLTLGREHNVVSAFWQYALAALQQMVPALGRHAEQMALESELPDYQQMMIALLNDLDDFSINNRTQDPLTLVLDDFHLLENPRLLQLFNLFLDHLPACIRVVITARGEPDLNLARRRASGQLLQLGIHELRFSPQESRDFFAAMMGAEEAKPWMDQLCQQTEGWIAGLQLAALSLQRVAPEAERLRLEEGLDKHIADYLLDEVFASLPVYLQHFLERTAIVKRFCAGLCNEIDHRTDSQSVLLDLETLNLFLVPLDNHRTWFRYHDLFRQFLLQRFASLDAAEQQWVLQRALAWLEQNGYWVDAVALGLSRESWPDVIRLLLELDAGTEHYGDEQWQQWLQSLPTHLLQPFPVLQKRLGSAARSAEIAAPAAPAQWVEPLTQQEKNVLELIAKGLSNKAIAAALQISLNTLKVHIRNLYGKMGVESRTQALLRAQQEDSQQH